MKILQVNCVYGHGSTGKITRDIHHALLSRGFRSVVCYGRGVKAAEPDVHKTCTEAFGKANNLISRVTGLMYGGCFFATRKLMRIIEAEKPDVVHHVGLKTILWGTLAAKLASVRGVVNAVSGLGIFFSEENQSLLSKILPKVLRFSHYRDRLTVIFQNDEDKSLFLNNRIIREDQAAMIKGSGVDLQQFCYSPEPEEGKIKVLLTARMIVEKGIFVLTDAALKLKEQYKGKVQFLLCGGLDDNPKAIREEELQAVCDGEYIQWLGYRTDGLNLLKDCHIVAFPSYYKEGLPKSLIEATAVGRPIVTTNSIGCKETVVDGYNGYLIPVKDSDTLADRLKRLIEDKALRQEMGKNSRRLAEWDFSIENVVRRHLEIYEDLSGVEISGSK